jgi:hypothetical protein
MEQSDGRVRDGVGARPSEPRWQRITNSAYGNAKKALAGAARVAGDLTLDITFNPPVEVVSAEISQLHTVVKNLQMQDTTMTR